jgi:hypothetical protein
MKQDALGCFVEKDTPYLTACLMLSTIRLDAGLKDGKQGQPYFAEWEL